MEKSKTYQSKIINQENIDSKSKRKTIRERKKGREGGKREKI
jgi:hypothetical protein